MADNDVNYPEGHFIGIWMAIGIAIFSGFGIPLSVVTGNYAFIGIGPGLGVAVGVAVGQLIENKYRQAGRIRALTVGERRRKSMAVAAGLVVFVLGVVIFLILLFV